MPQLKVAIVILNWNGKHFLEKFLPFLIKYNTPNSEIIIADNASHDDSVSYLEENYPTIRIIKNNKNYGFAKGYNDALKQIDAEYYVLLNSDIEVTEKWIEPVIELMDSDKTIGACQPKLLSYENKDEFEYAGAAGGFIDKLGYPFCRGRIFQNLEKDEHQYDDISEIFWATGACMFVRASVFNKVGGLDDDFFAHMEEIDFCWRLKNNGYRVMYCPASVIYHIGGGTLPKKNPKKTFLNFRNNFILLYKNLPRERIFPVIFVRLFLDTAAAFKFLSEGHVKDFFAVIHAHFAFYSAIGKHVRKRKTLKHIDVSCVYRKSIVFEHYVKKKKSFKQLDSDWFSI
ncbi:MAG TPA: glycosyltransferase family 2 protein [Bacteroidales bacterium]|nr:glycosyltransferase family 2 protein [Bacteroidales bacterium]HPS17713.1 glycosyltransferase family 2 protein [Bacteroidales bacterium]